MILRCPGFDREIEWNENSHLHELIIENQKYFRDFVKDFYFHNDDGSGISLTESGKALKFKDDVDVIINPLKLDFGNKKAVTNLLKLLAEASVSENYYLSTNKLKTKIVKYLSDVISTEQFGFEIEADDFSLDQIAKAVNFHVVGDEDDFVDLITDYLEMMRELAKTKIFVFIALRSFISDDELARLRENIMNHQLDVLLIEDQTRTKIDGIARMTIDADLCDF